MTPQQTIETEATATSFFDWIRANTRLLYIGAAVIAVGALGYWFYMRSAEIKRLNAERGLNQAKQSLAAGNEDLAKNDLERVATRYKGTPAGAQSAMLLAQIHYRAGNYGTGIEVLEPYQTPAAAGPSLAAVWSLTGDGLTGDGKPAEAAEAFEKAAQATSLQGESALYWAKAARSYTAAGKIPEAKAIWERLADDPGAAIIHNEAQIRLGELLAQPAGKS